MATVIQPQPSTHPTHSHSGNGETPALALTSETSRPEKAQGKKRPRLERHEMPFNWPVMAWIGIMHVAALTAPFVFSWQGVVLAVFLHWLTGGIGICLGFHRLLTHGSFKTYSWVRNTLAVIGGLAGEGGALDWVAAHRQHHAHSDQDDDPHSPNEGAWWSHMLWLSRSVYGKSCTDYSQRWAPDLAKDPAMQWISALAIPFHFALGMTLFLAGYLTGGAYMGLSFLIWGMFVRLVLVLHCTWFVNSASHMWGYRNYETTDQSRNNWWVALLSYGEGWHNNHHAYPRMANHGHRWFEVDLTYRAIRVMRGLGLAWDVVDYKHRNQQAA